MERGGIKTWPEGLSRNILQKNKSVPACRFIGYFAISVIFYYFKITMWKQQNDKTRIKMHTFEIGCVAECFLLVSPTASGNMKIGIITECIQQLIKLLNVLHFASLCLWACEQSYSSHPLICHQTLPNKIYPLCHVGEKRVSLHCCKLMSMTQAWHIAIIHFKLSFVLP